MHLLVEDKLQNIKVADPAVGSGAFPLGMINEIVRARKVLNVYLKNDISDYELKKHAITNSIYGVDIDPGAVDIAKLRLWLALVVDEETPHPLPNLEHKIMQGNSLISEYEGVKLFDDSFFEDAQSIEKEKLKIDHKLSFLQKEYFELHKNNELTVIKKEEIEKEIKSLQRQKKSFTEKPDTSNEVTGLFDLPQKKKIAQEKTRTLQAKINEYISESRRTHKQNLKEEIDNLKWELIEATLEEQGKADKLEEIKALRHKNIKPFFIWKLEFSDVFKEKSGFDVVIGNPPYIKEYTAKNAFDGLRDSPYYMGKMDLWYFFACLGLDLSRNHGVQAFIAPNNWISNFGAKRIREKVLKDAVIKEFIDFGNYKVFDTAGIQTMVYILEKNKNNDDYRINYARLNLEKPSSNDLTHFLKTKFDIVNDKYEKFVFDFEKIKFKNKNIQFLNPQIGEITNKIGNNSVFYLTDKEVAQGIVLPQDFLNKKNLEKLGNDFKKGDGIFALSEKEKSNLNLEENEKELIKPYFMNDKFYRYGTNSKNDFWIIYTDSKFKNISEIEKYPNIKKHLDKFKEVITSDNKPY